jgi:hypothetical protein
VLYLLSRWMIAAYIILVVRLFITLFPYVWVVWDVLAMGLVLRGFTQCPGMDYNETFNPVVKPASVWLSLSTEPFISWIAITPSSTTPSLRHSRFYCSQPTGFIDPAHPHLVCQLNKSLYCNLTTSSCSNVNTPWISLSVLV